MVADGSGAKPPTCDLASFALERGDESAGGSVGKSIGPNRVTLAPERETMVHGLMFLGTIGAPRAVRTAFDIAAVNQFISLTGMSQVRTPN
ncbi:hypothetical protein BH10PSE15_BH10PSE15_17580 [soil metagenome]